MTRKPGNRNVGYVPTLTNEEIMKLPIYPPHSRLSYKLTEKGKAAIMEQPPC